MTRFAGGCLCGRVRYSTGADPVFAGVCHCRDCQRFTGSAFETVVAFPKDAVTVEGTLKSYQTTGGSGQPVWRGFCPECGSGVTVQVGVMPELLLVTVGTLDDPAGVKPSMELFCDSAQPWVSLEGERQRFARMPG